MAENLLADHHALRGVFLYEFLQGRKCYQARRNICKVLGEKSVSRKVIKYWFEKFTKKSFDPDDNGRPPLDIDEDISRALKENPRATSRELSVTLKHPQRTIINHLHETGRVPKFGQLVPHDLTDSQKKLRCDLSRSLLTKKRTTVWGKDIITGDEKWVLYVNHTRKRQWLPAEEPTKPDLKGELHEKKVVLSFRWNRKSVIFRELLPNGATVNAGPYCIQL